MSLFHVREFEDNNVSDKDGSTAETVPGFVMAEQIAHDVVKEALSVGDHSLIDDIATPSNDSSAGNGQARNQLNFADADPIERADVDEKSAVGETAGYAEIQGNGEMTNDITEALRGESPINAFVDASGGSDSDTSRADASDVLKGLKGHVRSNSVKKPTTFKSVSVTKHFLAKAATAAPSARPGDKSPVTGPSPTSALSAAKPRLVAKSALGGAGARSGLGQLNGASGPDASKVWNKNRPIPPPPPRQFTDEELQTRYGIHLATRLQSDESGKDPKWADIDDDEDDWAPETVEWMDGTKSSVVTAEVQPTPPPQEEKKATALSDKAADAVKPVLSSMQKPAPAATTKTILKPSTTVQAKPGSLVLKGAPEKPTLVAKPSSATPAKSPWAPLPPVEKVSPVVINPSVQQPQPSRFQRDPHGFDSLPPAPSPAKEIAADDFNRSWREERGTKELFNSQSGRYEPVTEARRGSRHEHSHRQPAVLQRPSQTQQQQAGPAEPSAAFQTSRSSGGDVGSWARRRASSNLSAGSGRRPSIGRLQDIPMRSDRPDGMSPVSAVVESPQQAYANVERPGAGQASWVRTSTNGSVNEPQLSPEGPPPTNGEPPEDPVARQQRLMREKIERAKLAKQREKEAEEQEKQARAERLKLKLAALAAASPSPELKDTKTTKSPQQQKATPVASPPKPPVITAEGEVAQYGMMKVHQPQPYRKAAVTEASLTSKHSFEAPTEASSTSRPATSPMKSVARPTQSQQHPASTERNPKRLADSSAEKTAGSWKSPSPSEPYTWGNGTMNAHTVPGASVWGPPPNNEKALGNGTFETHSSFSHPNFNNRKTSDNRAGGNLAHGPIAPPSAHKISSSSRAPSQPDPSNINNSLASNNQIPSQNDQPLASAHLDSSSNASITHSQASLHPSATMAPVVALSSPVTPSFPAPIAPPTQQGRKRVPDADKVEGTKAWQLFSDNVSKRDGTSTWLENEERTRRNFLIAAFGEQAVAPKPQGPPPPMITSYKVRGPNGKFIKTVEIVTDRETGERISETITEHGPKKSAQAPATAATNTQTAQNDSTLPHRGSRFFPRADAEQPSLSNKSDSPPPPETSDHPAHDGKTKVKFPPPAPVVRLPGSQVRLTPRTDSPTVDSFEAAATPVTVTSQPTTGKAMKTQVDWQRKIDMLQGINRQAPTVNSASKAPLDVSIQNAIISLPGQTNAVPQVFVTPFVIDKTAGATSKGMADDELFEQPEFASKPTVRLPTQPHINHQFGYFHEGPYLATRYIPPVVTQSVIQFDFFPKETTNTGYKITIRFPYASVNHVKKVEVVSTKFRKPADYGFKTRRSFTPNKNNKGDVTRAPASRKSSGQINTQSQSPKPRSSNSWSSNRATSSNWNSNKRAVAGTAAH